MIGYAQEGGRLIALHHSISSGKRTNEQWFSFLGVDLPKGDVAGGGYIWIEGVTIEVANLARITSSPPTSSSILTWCPS